MPIDGIRKAKENTPRTARQAVMDGGFATWSRQYAPKRYTTSSHAKLYPPFSTNGSSETKSEETLISRKNARSSLLNVLPSRARAPGFTNGMNRHMTTYAVKYQYSPVTTGKTERIQPLAPTFPPARATAPETTRPMTRAWSHSPSRRLCMPFEVTQR